MNISAHIFKDMYVVQDFMSLLKENNVMSVHTMVLKMEACISVVNQNLAFEAVFSNERLTVYEAKWNSSGLDK
jgi:hypothetical protein